MASNGYLNGDVQKAISPSVELEKKSGPYLWLGWTLLMYMVVSTTRYPVCPSLLPCTTRFLQSTPVVVHKSVCISTPDWATSSIFVEIGVCQGDPLSVVIFVTVIITSPTLSPQ